MCFAAPILLGARRRVYVLTCDLSFPLTFPPAGAQVLTITIAFFNRCPMYVFE